MMGLLIPQVARPYFDDTLTRQYNRLKKAQVKTITYLETHSDLLGLVLPRQPLLAAVACHGEWGLAKDAILELLATGPLGKALFTFAGLSANSGAFMKGIDGLLEKLATEGFTDDKINEFKKDAAALTTEFEALHHAPCNFIPLHTFTSYHCNHSLCTIASMQAINALERTRTINLKLNTQTISIVIRDPTSEWDLRLMNSIKTAALGASGGLEPLAYEKWLMDFSSVPPCSVPEELLAPMRAARACAAEILAGVDAECFADIQKAP